jgi:replication factor C subunit 3/5
MANIAIADIATVDIIKDTAPIMTALIPPASIPWVEKYRPNTFDNIVLDPLNKIILNNIIEQNSFPNLLLYGPPGTGKTTTIINLIHKYQVRNNQVHKGLIIHLNASDERGIDIIRNQIRQFVGSDNLFVTGLKFVILDEVDYMTKHAQQSLKYLLQYSNTNVRFCLICNYISRIDDSLQSEFMRLRFNQLPEKDIFLFLQQICKSEDLLIGDDKLLYIQKLYKSDIRSMINYIQANKNIILDLHVLNTALWQHLTQLFLIKNNHTAVLQYLTEISYTYNIDIKNIVKDYLNYLIADCPTYICKPLLDFMETVMHLKEFNVDYFKHYTALQLNKLLSAS